MKILKEFKWEMAHKLYKSYTCKCQNIHGHSYKAILELESDSGSLKDGVVLDFTKVKEVFGATNMLDHTLLLYEKDPLARHLQSYDQGLAEKSIYFMKVEPTAENIAGWLFQEAYASLKSFDDVKVKSVTVWETATSAAKCSRRYPGLKNAIYKGV